MTPGVLTISVIIISNLKISDVFHTEYINDFQTIKDPKVYVGQNVETKISKMYMSFNRYCNVMFNLRISADRCDKSKQDLNCQSSYFVNVLYLYLWITNELKSSGYFGVG